MLVLPIVNKNRVLNVGVSLKNASKIRTSVQLDRTAPGDIIVNGKSFATSSFSDARDGMGIIDFIRANSILYKRDFFVTTKENSDGNYDVYTVPLPPSKVNDSMDELYISTILDMIKETPGVTKGKYLSLKSIGLDDVFSDEKVTMVRRIVSLNPTEEWNRLFSVYGLTDLIDTLDFMRMFDCTVIGESTISEDVFKQVLDSFDKLHSRDTKGLNKYYNMAIDNRDVYAKMSYVNKLISDKPLDLIQSEAQRRNKQFVKADNVREKTRKCIDSID